MVLIRFITAFFLSSGVILDIPAVPISLRRAFISRVSASDRIPFLVIDWYGENEVWAREANATLWKVPEHFKVNLFKLNGLSKESRASIAVDGLAVYAHLTALQSTKVKSALLKFYLDGKEPTLLELWEAPCGRHAGKGNVLNQRLRGIQRVIGSEPEGFWNSIFTGNNVVSMIGLNENEKALVAYSILQRLTELFDKEQWQGKGPRLMVVIDEAWQILRRLSSIYSPLVVKRPVLSRFLKIE